MDLKLHDCAINDPKIRLHLQAPVSHVLRDNIYNLPTNWQPDSLDLANALAIYWQRNMYNRIIFYYKILWVTKKILCPLLSKSWRTCPLVLDWNSVVDNVSFILGLVNERKCNCSKDWTIQCMLCVHSCPVLTQEAREQVKCNFMRLHNWQYNYDQKFPFHLLWNYNALSSQACDLGKIACWWCLEDTRQSKTFIVLVVPVAKVIKLPRAITELWHSRAWHNPTLHQPLPTFSFTGNTTRCIWLMHTKSASIHGTCANVAKLPTLVYCLFFIRLPA